MEGILCAHRRDRWSIGPGLRLRGGGGGAGKRGAKGFARHAAREVRGESYAIASRRRKGSEPEPIEHEIVPLTAARRPAFPGDGPSGLLLHGSGAAGGKQPLSDLGP